MIILRGFKGRTDLFLDQYHSVSFLTWPFGKWRSDQRFRTFGWFWKLGRGQDQNIALLGQTFEYAVAALLSIYNVWKIKIWKFWILNISSQILINRFRKSFFLRRSKYIKKSSNILEKFLFFFFSQNCVLWDQLMFGQVNHKFLLKETFQNIFRSHIF